jgi:hypothetical protein
LTLNHNKMAGRPNLQFSSKKYDLYFKNENELKVKIRIVATRLNLMV